MSRGSLVLIVVLVVVVGGALALSRRNSEVPQSRVEKVVPNAALAH